MDKKVNEKGLRKSKARDKKRKKKQHGMRVDSKSVFRIQEEQIKRAEKIKKRKEIKMANKKYLNTCTISLIGKATDF